MAIQTSVNISDCRDLSFNLNYVYLFTGSSYFVVADPRFIQRSTSSRNIVIIDNKTASLDLEFGNTVTRAMTHFDIVGEVNSVETLANSATQYLEKRGVYVCVMIVAIGPFVHSFDTGMVVFYHVSF